MTRLVEPKLETFAELAAGEKLRGHEPADRFLFARHQAAARKNTTGRSVPDHGAVRAIGSGMTDYTERGIPSMWLTATIGRKHGERLADARAASAAEISSFRRASARLETRTRDILDALPYDQGDVLFTVDETHPERSSIRLQVTEPEFHWWEYAADFNPDISHGTVSSDEYHRYNKLWNWATADIAWAFIELLIEEGVWVPWHTIERYGFGALEVRHDLDGYIARTTL